MSPIVSLPKSLSEPIVIDGEVALKIMLDVTAYLVGPTELEFDFLFDLYSSVCPKSNEQRYKIAELEHWPLVSQPDLTRSGRIALSSGISRPYFEPVRNRIRSARAFEASLWDGRSINDPGGSWSFSCKRIKLKSDGFHSFVRILVPLQTDLKILLETSLNIAQNVEFISGHGGLSFVYHPALKGGAFNAIYPRSRRFWGIDVEDLNVTLPLFRENIKGVNWITLLGRGLSSKEDVIMQLDSMKNSAEISISTRQFGYVIVAAPEPQLGDQNRLGEGLAPYYKVAKGLSSLFLTECPDFSGEAFVEHGNTLGWIRRFIEPDGWR
jgi:Protein of unknown function (DUF3396)